ncbi:MAG: S1C family serine protease [Candidatus Saccharibacteria bacterium]
MEPQNQEKPTELPERQAGPAPRRRTPASSYVAASAAALVLMLLIAAAVTVYSAIVDSKAKQIRNEARVAGLQKEIRELKDNFATVNTEQQKTALSLQEMSNRQAVRQKSQDELLTAAVNRVAPAVVSVVISKDVPKLEVVYQNPFGDDPYFKNFNLQIPVYRQNGTQKQRIGAGTGFIVSSDGYILTNKHVAADRAADYTVLLSDGRQRQARVVYLDPDNDLAVIKIDGKYPAVNLGDSNVLKLGQSVIAIGNALGEYNNSVSVGIISGLDRKITASGQNSTETLSGVIQTDAAINPGNSGGPLIDLNGRVVGINVATVIGSNSISFSIPINSARSAIKQALGR